ncbi:hypothetical protein C8Q74DRAFT_1348564 [Fomes fomentarius]|nr:hypothetical protein C8Q74DRAFT_1348564 [Fomes fomentarius]
MSTALIGEYWGGPGTGSLGGPPSGHNYKRAVYRMPPKDFAVDVLSPTKFGSGYCYGMRISSTHPEDTDGYSTQSGSSHHEYDVWRRWEDCLWFQEILESEYALMARQKRARLVAGKGVKKNGVYIQSDHAASFESLPPGPDANTIAKDIHELIPRLSKKGTLFRASQATIEQRGREFEALINALFQEDVPMLVKELRETRLVRDFFGYWRRDLDHDRKRQSVVGKDGPNARHSIAGSVFSMYFSASNISLHLPTHAFADLPPSPALPAFPSQDSSRRNSIQRDEPRRRSTGRAPVSYATSDSSSSTASVASSSRGPPHSPATQAQDMMFYVSERGSLALNIVDDDERAEYINTPLSAPARVQPHPWTRDADRSFPAQDEEILMPDGGKPRQHPGLQALPEDSEFVPAPTANASQHSEIEEVSRTPLRRPRNNSCPDKSVRQCLFIAGDEPRSAHLLDGLHLDKADTLHALPSRGARPPSHLTEADPRTPTTNSSRPSSMAFSGFSYFTDQSSRSSWRTSMASQTSVAQSFGTSFANGSCVDFDRQSRHSFASSFANGSCADFDRDRDRGRRESRRSIASMSSSGRRTALGHRESMTTINAILSDLSLDSMLGRSITPPPSGSLRRSLSAGSRRPPSILAALGGQEDWYEQQEDFLDAYFYDPGIHAATLPSSRFEEPPRTPPPPPQSAPPLQQYRKDYEAHREPSTPATPDRFPKPFQNRPLGQFHLPWFPSPPTTPATAPARRSSRPSTSGGIVSTPSTPSTSGIAGSPPTSPFGPSSESITLKAVLQGSIVLLRISRSMPLSEVRTRLRDKFAAQEGVQLSHAFVIGWAPSPTQPGGVLRGRPRSNSASSVGSMNPSALRYVYQEQEWRAAVAACAGGKMTIRLFNAQSI